MWKIFAVHVHTIVQSVTNAKDNNVDDHYVDDDT